MAINYGFTNPYLSAYANKPGTISTMPVKPGTPQPVVASDPITGGPAVAPRPGTDRFNRYADYTNFDQDMTRSGFVRDFLEPDVPRGVYDRYFLERNGYIGPDQRTRFMRGNMGRAEQAYENQLLSTPDLRFSDFLKGYTGLADEWVNMSASQRGMNVPTRTQVIRWG
jgi:hypothetical protein